MGKGAGILKVLAIVSSVALGGAYVAYRQGYFRKESPQPVASSGTTTGSPSRPTVLPGSKNIDAVLSQPRDHVIPLEEPTVGAASAGADELRPMLPSSKSMQVFPEADQAVKPKPVPRRMVLPGSKSAPIELEPESEPQAPSQPQSTEPQSSK